MRLLVVGYALATVSEEAVGGAEQVAATLDGILARDRAHATALLAAAGSRGACTLRIAAPVPERIDAACREAATVTMRETLRRVIAELRPEVLHLHGLDFAAVLPRGAPPGG